METKQTLKNCNTQKLLILNELAKTVDLNLFNKIYFNEDNEEIQLYANYHYDLFQLLKNIYGNPKTYFYHNMIQILFKSETISFILMIENLKY